MRSGLRAETLVLAVVMAFGIHSPAALDTPAAQAASDIITGPATAPAQTLKQTGSETCTCPPSNFTPAAPGARDAASEIRLSEADEIAALSSIQTALSHMDDGTPYVWKRGSSALSGVVRPTKTFRNAKGSVCRHLVVLLTTGRRTQTAEGIACRLAGGRWQLEG